MTDTTSEAVNVLIKDAILESDSPVPTLLDVARFTPKDYIPLSEDGLGEIKQIGVYPPGKDLHSSCFWYLCLHTMESDLTFPRLEGYDCTTVVLPKKNGTNPQVKLQRKDKGEASTAVKPLFPHSWSGDSTTHYVVANAPVTSLQFMIKRNQGKAQFRVDKLDKSVSSESSDNSRRLVLSSFALVYVVEGHIKVVLDENHSNSHTLTLSAGETLYVQRDDDASPTSMVMQACDSQGSVSHHDFDATMVTIQITESGITSTNKSKIESPLAEDVENEPPHPRQRRSSSLVVYDTKDISAMIARTETENQRRDSLSSIYPGEIDARQMYEPPHVNDSLDVPEPTVCDKLSIEDFPVGKTSTTWIRMMMQGLSEWVRLPVIVCRGTADGPVVGITAAVHGNELNGVPCIHKVVAAIDVTKLQGTVVAVPCVNVVGYLAFQRGFADGRDLNRNFPGSEDGYASQVFCYQLMEKIISQFNYLIDLHTASFGRVNSYYVRADMNDEMSARMAKLQQPQIILHNSGQDGTLRSAASARGIRAITVEIGNPQLFQDQLVQWTYAGVMRILDQLKMLPMNTESIEGPSSTILCSKGFWMYTKMGGVLEVYPAVNMVIKKGDLVARIKNLFGHVVDEYFAPCGGIVIGRSSNPVAMAGDRILHLGVIKKKGEALSKAAKENY